MPLVLNIDFGGVLSKHDGRENKQQSIKAEHRSTAVNVPGAQEALRTLKAAGHRLVLNSFCGRKRAEETKAALTQTIPGILHQTFFVKDAKHKGFITQCTGADVMIDDRLDVLQEITRIDPGCPLLLWFTEQNKQLAAQALGSHKIVPVNSWSEIVTVLQDRETLNRPAAVIDPKKIYQV